MLKTWRINFIDSLLLLLIDNGIERGMKREMEQVTCFSDSSRVICRVDQRHLCVLLEAIY